jgi:hypothetical protein
VFPAPVLVLPVACILHAMHAACRMRFDCLAIQNVPEFWV